jgi:hypothetical protein
MYRHRETTFARLLELHPRRGVELRIQVELDPASREGGMPTEKNSADKRPLLQAFAPLHRSALGMACGVVLGGLLAAATLALVIQGGYPEPNLNLLAQFFWGYSISWRGVFIGFLWGWGVGFILGWGFALVRNAAFWIWLTAIRSRAEMEQYSDFLDHL